MISLPCSLSHILKIVYFLDEAAISIQQTGYAVSTGIMQSIVAIGLVKLRF